MVNITHSRYKPMQYISVKGDIVDVNPYAIQLFHRVKCIWFKSQILAKVFIYVRAAFMTVFAQHPEAIIRWWLL